MAQITQGLVSVTNGSATVSGTGTSWLGDVEPTNEFTVAADGVLYTIASVDSDTQVTLSAPYAGDTATDVPYAIVRDFTQDGFALLNQGDIETATVFTRSMRRIQTRFNAPSEISALAAADIYTSVQAGVDGTTSGDYFFVIGGGDYVLYSNDSGNAVEEFVFTNQQELINVLETVTNLEASVTENHQDFFTAFIGSFNSDPTEDTFGDPLKSGAMYFSTEENVLKFYDGQNWIDSSEVAISAAQDAQNSADAAAASESNASDSEAAAATSETNAAASESAASESETNAAASESAAAASESNAATSETNAHDSENKAFEWAEKDRGIEVETNQYSSKHHALESADSASAASVSESNAATSETNAQNSADAAATSETNAAASESNAATSETNAQNSATDSANARDSSQDARDLSQQWANEQEDVVVEDGEYSSKHYSLKSESARDMSQDFRDQTQVLRDDTESLKDTTNSLKNETEGYRDEVDEALFDINARYYGPDSSDPLEDLNGNPPTVGDWYFNTSNNEVRVFDGDDWNIIITPIDFAIGSQDQHDNPENEDDVARLDRMTAALGRAYSRAVGENNSDLPDNDIVMAYLDAYEQSSENYTDDQVSAHESSVGGVHGVPTGEEVEWKSSAQDKANTAESNANSYTDARLSDGDTDANLNSVAVGDFIMEYNTTTKSLDFNFTGA